MSTIIKQTTTDTKRYEQELEESRNRLTGIIASAMDAIISIDEDQKIILFNSAAEKVFGYTSDTIMGKSLDVLIPQRFRSPHHNHIQHFGQTGVTNRDMGRLGTLFGIRSNGEEFQIEASISQVQAGRGRIFTVILRDVTARVENERKLIENEQQLRATFEQAAIGIAHQSLQGQWLRVNPGFCGITGYTSDELLTKIAREISHPDDVRRDDELKEQLLRREIPTYSLEKRFIKKDGTIIWVNQTISLVLDRHGEPLYLINVIEDITARKNAETALQARTDEIKTMTQQLWQTAKLATMGELAASIAHELNNPLAILSLRIESLVANPAYTNGDMRELQIMQHEIERMAYLVSNLLQFSRSGHRQISSLHIQDEVEQSLELIHNHLLHRNIRIQRDYETDTPLIQADRQQLRQLFLNLFSNASDAMPEGGELSIQIKTIDPQTIHLLIRDTGVGIPPEILKMVMEPFYTTKLEGKGTGLGLSISRRIVEEHGGTMHISSQGLGHGVEINITLPAHATHNDVSASLIDE